MQVQVDIILRPHGTEPLLVRNKYHRDKYGWYQSLNVIACCCCCLSRLATLSTDAVCRVLLLLLFKWFSHALNGRRVPRVVVVVVLKWFSHALNGRRVPRVVVVVVV